jgi:hypothetical protein
MKMISAKISGSDRGKCLQEMEITLRCRFSHEYTKAGKEADKFTEILDRLEAVLNEYFDFYEEETTWQDGTRSGHYNKRKNNY